MNSWYGYYYGNEADQYTFYRIPKALFTNDRFYKLSGDAKILYGLMLDRMSLSVKNNWLDDQNRVFIYFTLEDVQEYLNCGRDKGIKLLAELDTEKGVGLIERIRQGLGKPMIIYVKKFFDSTEVQKSVFPTSGLHLATTDLQRSEKPTSGLPDDPTSRGRKNRLLDIDFSDSNNTENNNTENNNTESIPFQSPNPFQFEPVQERKRTTTTESTVKNEFDLYCGIIKDNIDYETFVMNPQMEKERIDEMVEIMVETICSTKKTIRVSGDDFPAEVVKAKLLRLSGEHIRFALKGLDENTTQVRNMKKYLLAVLFNAPSTLANSQAVSNGSSFDADEFFEAALIKGMGQYADLHSRSDKTGRL